MQIQLLNFLDGTNKVIFRRAKQSLAFSTLQRLKLERKIYASTYVSCWPHALRIKVAANPLLPYRSTQGVTSSPYVARTHWPWLLATKRYSFWDSWAIVKSEKLKLVCGEVGKIEIELLNVISQQRCVDKFSFIHLIALSKSSKLLSL